MISLILFICFSQSITCTPSYSHPKGKEGKEGNKGGRTCNNTNNYYFDPTTIYQYGGLSNECKNASYWQHKMANYTCKGVWCDQPFNCVDGNCYMIGYIIPPSTQLPQNIIKILGTGNKCHYNIDITNNLVVVHKKWYLNSYTNFTERSDVFGFQIFIRAAMSVCRCVPQPYVPPSQYSPFLFWSVFVFVISFMTTTIIIVGIYKLNRIKKNETKPLLSDDSNNNDKQNNLGDIQLFDFS